MKDHYAEILLYLEEFLYRKIYVEIFDPGTGELISLKYVRFKRDIGSVQFSYVKHMDYLAKISEENNEGDVIMLRVLMLKSTKMSTANIP